MMSSNSKSKPKRIITRLHQGQAIVVGDIEDFENIILLFEAMAEMDVYSESEKESWRNAADHYRSSISRSVGYFSESDQDW